MGPEAAAQVVLHDGADALDPAGLIGAARDIDIIVADRLTEAPAEVFERLPKLRALVAARSISATSTSLRRRRRAYW